MTKRFEKMSNNFENEKLNAKNSKEAYEKAEKDITQLRNEKRDAEKTYQQ